MKLKSRVYLNINARKPKHYYDYENCILKWGDPDKYGIVKKIGRGKYSNVFEGRNLESNETIVIKVLKPVKSKKINREIKILQNLQSGPNIVKLFDVVKDEDSDTPSLIMEYVDNTYFRNLYPYFTIEDVRYYCYEILKGLDYTHSMGIIHRDIKPHNIMIDHKKREVRIVDWGLAEFYHPGVKLNVHVSSRCFKGPELLVNHKDYDYSLDIWSFGCTLAGMIFKKDIFFRSSDNFDQLVKICEVTGTRELFDYIETYKLKLHRHYDGLLFRDKYKKKKLENFRSRKNQDLATPLAIDLCEKMFSMDPRRRYTAKEAMSHPFFDKVREEEYRKKKMKDEDEEEEESDGDDSDSRENEKYSRSGRRKYSLEDYQFEKFYDKDMSDSFLKGR